MSEKKLLFTVNGFEIRSNSSYKVKDKPDGDAPTGFQELGVTKLPSDGVDECFQVPYKQVGANGEGIWDTGFFVHSPCYANMEESQVKVMVKSVVDNLLKPYRSITGNPKAFEEGNEEFLGKTNFKIYTGLTFDTNNMFDLMTLYFALRGHKVAPEGSKGDSKYRNCAYLLIDKNRDVKEKDRRKALKFESIGLFQTLFEQDKTRLYAVLNWINLRVGETTDKMTAIGIFDEYISGSHDKSEAFLNTVKESETKVGLDKLMLYQKLKDSANRNAKITKLPNGTYFYDGTIEIGKDLKSCADNISKLKDLDKVKRELLLLTEEDN